MTGSDALIAPIVQELDSKKFILDCGFTVQSKGVKRADIFEFKAQSPFTQSRSANAEA